MTARIEGLPSALVAMALVTAVHVPAQGQGSLTVGFTTTGTGGTYEPRHCLAVWIEDAAGNHVDTFALWADRRIEYLRAWNAASGRDVDVVSGATLGSHTRHTVTWDLTDDAGVEVADGRYTIRMEVVDSHPSGSEGNNQGVFAFEKNGTDSTQSTAGGGFLDVRIDYTASGAGPAAAVCDDGVVQADETCDPVASCPTTCGPGVDACRPLVLSGAAANCTAACIEQPITACVAGDACCPGGCTSATDGDCRPDGRGTLPDAGAILADGGPRTTDAAAAVGASGDRAAPGLYGGSNNRLRGSCQAAAGSSTSIFGLTLALVALVAASRRRYGTGSRR